MATSSEFREHVLDLLWSQWRELGVAATVPRRHGDDCLDPEALIAFTAIHSDLDARLRDESIDWVLRYGSYVSRARLKNILSDWDETENLLFQEYAATVSAQGRAGWPAGRAQPLAFRSRARPLLQDLRAPALLSLRIRAVFGVGARAELIRALLVRPQSTMTASELAAETSYGKRNVLNELEPLRFAGVVRSFRAVNADRYSLAMTNEIRALLAPLPGRFTRWTQTFAAIHLILELIRHSARRSDLLNAVDALRVFVERNEVFSAAGIYPPALPKGAAAWPRFMEWAVERVKVLAGA
jgi:hypothetical protein